MSDAKESALERLSEESAREFPHLLAARAETAKGLQDRRARLAKLPHDDDVSVVLMGSWGRSEVTSGSDDDFMVLVDGPERDHVQPSIAEVKTVLTRAAGDQGMFGVPVFCDSLVDNIGLDADDNNNLSRRMLFVLESLPATADDVYLAAKERVLRRYLDESIKDFRPPRFLLNDTVRYWRTMCVDFAAKELKSGEKWGLRNAKLRTSRKVLFAGGLLPILECHKLAADDMFAFLAAQFGVPPTDRIAEVFLTHAAPDAGARALGAYDEFLGLLDDAGFRQALKELTRADADRSQEFDEVRRLGKSLEEGLLALLFETESLPKIVRDYGIF